MEGILIGVVLLFVIVIGLSSIKIVRQSNVAMVERLGKYTKTLHPGFNFIIPFFDRVSQHVDLRTQTMDSEPQPVITKDNVGMMIDTVTWFKVTDPFKSVYEIEDLHSSILSITATTLRDVVGGMELDETYTSREKINSRLREELDDATNAWGVKIERVEVKNINPPADIREAMEKQMRAERTKRAQILEAEGLKEAQIRNAEGDKESAILRAEAQKASAILAAEAEKESQIRKAEGQAEAILRIAEADKKQISLVYSALKEANLDDTILRLESIKAMKELAHSDNKVFLPYESSQIMGAIGSLKELSK